MEGVERGNSIGCYRKFSVVLQISQKTFGKCCPMVASRRLPLQSRNARRGFVRPLPLLIFLLFALSMITPVYQGSSASTAHLATSNNTQPDNTIVSSVPSQPKSEGVAKNDHGIPSPASSADPSASAVTYQGGPIQLQQNVYLIFWLPSGQHYEPTGSDTFYEQLITDYFEDVGGSQFYEILGQYPDTLDGAPTTTVHVGGVFVDSSPYPESGNQSSPLLGTDIISEVETYLATGAFPIGIDDEFYVFTAYGIDSCQTSADTICSFPTSESAGYCAYHSYFEYDGYSVTFADMGDNPGTSGCEISLSSIGASAYLYGDGLADSEVSLASQEQFDTVSDPILNSWYASSSSTGEISDLCAGSYGPLGASGGNVVLNGQIFLVQEEWSNSAGTCTVTGPQVTPIQVTMTAAAGSDSLSTSNYFQISFAIGKQLFIADYTGQPMQFNADPDTTLTISGTSSASALEKWCLELSCGAYSVNLGTSTLVISLTYYDLLAQTAIEFTSTPAPPSFDTLSYSTAAETAGTAASPLASTLTLSNTSQNIWVLRGSTINVTQQTQTSPTSSQERWYTAAESITVTQVDQLAPVQSFQQYLVTYDDTVVGSSGGQAPAVVYYFLGVPETTTGGSSAWTDAGTTYSYSTTIGTSTSTERLDISPGTGSGTATTSATIDITYYQQFYVSVGYSVGGSVGNTSPVTFSAQLFGAPISFKVGTQSLTSSWLDAGSTYLLPSVLTGSNSTVRWAARLSGTSGTISSATLQISPTYYYQYSISFSYSVNTASGGLAPPSQPTLLYSFLNTETSVGLSTTPTAVWLDAGSSYSLGSVVSASGTERWAAVNETSNIATAPGSTTLVLYDQYEVVFLAVITGGGSPVLPLLNTTTFGQGVSVNLANSTEQVVWIDVGSPYSITNPLRSTSTSERWIAASTNATGIISSPQSVSIQYYHQYLEILSYSLVNGGSPSGGPTVSYTSMGAAASTTASITGIQEWVDAGTQYSFESMLPGSSSSETWNANNATASGVFTSAGNASVAYNHQYYVTAITNTPLAQLPASISGWYDPGASLILTAPSASGWKFEEWAGTYFGNSSTLLLTVVSPITETAVYYVGLTLTAKGYGSISYSFENVTGSVGEGHTETIYVPPNQNLKLQGSGFPIIFKFSGWTGNASSLIPPANSNTTILDTVNPFVLTIRAPTSVIAEYSVNFISVGIVAAIIVVGGVAAMLVLRKPPPPSEFEETRSVENQPIARVN